MAEAADALEVWNSETSTSVNAITMNGVGLTYSHRSSISEVLGRIDLSIQEGEFVCVLGPSGCGKTSLLKMIAGYEKSTLGETQIYGRPHRQPHHDVGVVFQHANLFPWLSVQANVEFGLKMLNYTKTNRKQIANTIINEVGLSSFASLLPYQLSGGMKQRTAIARALATNPRIVLMDEPFASLDAITRESLQSLLRKLWINTGKTILFITHDVDEALLLGSRIIVMKGSPGQIKMDIPNITNNNREPFAFARQHLRYAELRDNLVKELRPTDNDRV